MEGDNVIRIGESQTSFLRRALDEALEETLKKQETSEPLKTKPEPTPLPAATADKSPKASS